MQQKVIRGNSKIPAPSVFISEAELCGNDPTVEAAFDVLKEKMGETNAIEYLLVNLWGFDKMKLADGSDKFYAIEELQHRARISKNVIKGNRYVGYERLDDEWILRGNPSDEAKMAARQDASYLQEIRNLSKTSKISRV